MVYGVWWCLVYGGVWSMVLWCMVYQWTNIIWTIVATNAVSHLLGEDQGQHYVDVEEEPDEGQDCEDDPDDQVWQHA